MADHPIGVANDRMALLSMHREWMERILIAEKKGVPIPQVATYLRSRMLNARRLHPDNDPLQIVTFKEAADAAFALSDALNVHALLERVKDEIEEEIDES